MAKQLRIADHPYTIVFGEVVKALKADPVLRRVVKTWLTYTDEADEPADDTSNYPSIELLPFGEPALALTQVQQEAPMGITVILSTDGMDVRDNLNLWGVFSDALFKGDGQAALSKRIRDALVASNLGSHFISLRIAVPAITPIKDPRESKSISTKGLLIASMTVRK
jgi:hypothetical protein